MAAESDSTADYTQSIQAKLDAARAASNTYAQQSYEYNVYHTYSQHGDTIAALQCSVAVLSNRFDELDLDAIHDSFLAGEGEHCHAPDVIDKLSSEVDAIRSRFDNLVKSRKEREVPLPQLENKALKLHDDDNLVKSREEREVQLLQLENAALKLHNEKLAKKCNALKQFYVKEVARVKDRVIRE